MKAACLPCYEELRLTTRLWAAVWILSLTAGSITPTQAAEQRSVPGIDMQFMPIPAGRFVMGSPPDEPGRENDENPQTDVTIQRPFWLGKYEVTHGQWRALMGTDLDAIARQVAADQTLYSFGNRQLTIAKRNGIDLAGGYTALLGDTGDDVPMYLVHWDDAVAFCKKLTERERAAGRLPAGYVYRLPTDAEWEYAARAGTSGAIYSGVLKIEGESNAPALDPIAWYAGNSGVGYTGRGFDMTSEQQRQYPQTTMAGPRHVGLKQPNAWGLHDMIGNVWEWAADWFEPALPGGQVVDPRGPVAGTHRVVRGGGWNNPVVDNRSAQRYGLALGESGRRINLGFRVALAVPLE